jgi:2,4-diaminopentanoate dehydrogenase
MKTARVVQWTTGLVARQAVKAIVERPDLELVGVYAFSNDKVGQDAGDLVGLGRQLGIRATDDIEALIALQPDCVVYMPLHPDVEHVELLLRSGINVVTTAFVTGRSLGGDVVARLDDAAQAGGVSLFGSGIHPGHTDLLAVIASAYCREVHYVRVLETADLSLWANNPNQDEFGWGRPANDPGHAADVERATAVDLDALDLLAQLMGLTLDDTRCEVEFAHATADLDIPGRPVKKGHVAGMDIRWIGICGGVEAVEVNLRWTLGTQIEPAWEQPATFFTLEVKGTPSMTLGLGLDYDDLSALSMDDMMGLGQLITAMPVVNAIHAVIAARPGFLTHIDLPPVAAPFAPRR